MAWAARRTRQGRLLGGPGFERGSAAFGVAIIALTTRIHHYGTSSTGKTTTTGLIVAVVVLVIIVALRRFTGNRKG